MADENESQLTAEAAPVLAQTVLDAETFQAWQSELNEFIAVTGNRLQSLSQSVSRCQRVGTTSQDNREIVPQSETIASTPIDRDPSPRIEPPAQQPSHPGNDSPENNVVNQDPMQRLSAIKNRLANQMQNAS